MYYILLNAYALRAVQTSGPTAPSTCLLRASPFFISGKYGSRGSYIEQINTGQNIEKLD